MPAVHSSSQAGSPSQRPSRTDHPTNAPQRSPKLREPQGRGSTTLCDRIKSVVCSLCGRTRGQSDQRRRGSDSSAVIASEPVRGSRRSREWATALRESSNVESPRRRARAGNDPARLRVRPVLAPPSSTAADPTATPTPRRVLSVQVDPASWMASLPDHVKLDTLFLPGTHQSLARNYPLASSLCQTTSLTHQLEHGIRALDLRFSLREEDGTLWAYHGPVPQRREMGEVFEEIYRFLESEAGRQEAVLVSLKQENAAPGFAEAVWNLIDSTRPAMWYHRNAWPTLSQVRGCCVMFCRFGFESGRGLHPPIWPNDKRYLWKTEIGGRETVVQDWYGVRSPLSLPEKANLALSLFDPSSPAMLALNPHPSTHSTFHSASPSHIEPRTISYRINFLSCGSFPTLYPSHAAKGFGAPRFGLGYRGVNALVAEGLESLRSRAEAIEAGREEASPFEESTEDAAAHRFSVDVPYKDAELEVDSALSRSPASEQPEEEKPPPLRLRPPPPRPGSPSPFPTRSSPASAGQKRRDGHGGMLVFLDFWEAPRKARLVDQIIEMNF